MHRATRTLVPTGLAEHLESAKLPLLTRLVMRLASTTAPDGRAMIGLRAIVKLRRPASARTAKRLLALDPERVIFAHGKWFGRDAAPQLRRFPIIERTTLVKPTTAWVLHAAIAQLAKWNDAGLDLQLSVNISAANLEEEDFAERVQLHLLRHRVRPGQLELEVTESAVMGNADRALVQLEALAEAGIRIAIDDFGTGYSSLAYLQRLPADVVKIDQAFVRDLDDGGERARTLVGSMITLSQGLGYRVVAEGVETAASADLLATMGCDEAQGYFFARPLEQANFAAWMKVDGEPTGAARAA